MKVAASPRIYMGRCPIETLDVGCQISDIRYLMSDVSQSPGLPVSQSPGLLVTSH